jgi:lysyl-tRNA synthetase class I
MREYPMSAKVVRPEAAEYYTPKITCPRCSKIMRLARVEQEPDKETGLLFDCDCGFEYRMSERAQAGA